MEVQWPLVFNIALGIIFGLLGWAILVEIGHVVVRFYVNEGFRQGTLFLAGGLFLVFIVIAVVWSALHPTPIRQADGFYYQSVDGVWWDAALLLRCSAEKDRFFSRVPVADDLTIPTARAVAERAMAEHREVRVLDGGEGNICFFHWKDGKTLYPPEEAKVFWTRFEEGKKER